MRAKRKAKRQTKSNMITKEQIITLCEEALADTDRFLVEVKVKPQNVIEV